MSTSPSPSSADLREILGVLQALRRGDFSARVAATHDDPVAAEIASTLNATMDQLALWNGEVTALAGKIRGGDLWSRIPMTPPTDEIGQLPRPSPPAGQWTHTADELNATARLLMDTFRNLGLCLCAARDGVYVHRVRVEVGGEMNELKDTVNELLDRLDRTQQPAPV